jgi:hypothetical protein
MARFLVQNCRPRKVVRVLGRLLASAVSAGEAGKLWLDEAEFKSASVQRLLAIGRLRLVSTETPEEESPVAIPTPAPTVAAPPPSPPPSKPPAPPEVPEAPASPEAPSDKPPLPPGNVALSEDELKAMKKEDLKSLADEMGIPSDGTKAELIARLLAGAP